MRRWRGRCCDIFYDNDMASSATPSATACALRQQQLINSATVRLPPQLYRPRLRISSINASATAPAARQHQRSAQVMRLCSSSFTLDSAPTASSSSGSISHLSSSNLTLGKRQRFDFCTHQRRQRRHRCSLTASLSTAATAPVTGTVLANCSGPSATSAFALSSGREAIRLHS